MPRTRVLYDGQCPLCQFSVRQLRRLDWFGTLEYLDARRPETFPADLPPVDPGRILEEMHVATSGGAVLSGFRALRYLAWRLPLTCLIAPLLHLPGVTTLGQWLYLKIAKNRYNLAPCKDGVCSLPPQSTQAPTGSQAPTSANPSSGS